MTATAGSDYMALSSETVTFAASTSTLTQTVMVTITDDNVDEVNETFTVSFGTLPLGVIAGATSSVTVIITDNDVPEVSFTPATATVVEDAGTVDVTVELDSSPAETLVIPVETVNGTATAGSDYTVLNRNITFAAGATILTQTVPVTIMMTVWMKLRRPSWCLSVRCHQE